MFQVLNLELREPPKDAMQPPPEGGYEGQEPENVVAEDKTENEAESQKETENKLKEKVTLKELANQSKAEKVQKETSGTENKENKVDEIETESAEKDMREFQDNTSHSVQSNDIDRTVSELQDVVPESADVGKQVDLTTTDENQPVSESVTVSAEEKQPVEEAVTDIGMKDEQGGITPEDVKADLKAKAVLMMQDDTTDSEVTKYLSDKLV